MGKRPVIKAHRGRRGRVDAALNSPVDFEGRLLTLDELSYPDWKEHLARAERESAAGQGIRIEDYTKKRARKRRFAESTKQG